MGNFTKYWTAHMGETMTTERSRQMLNMVQFHGKNGRSDNYRKADQTGKIMEMDCTSSYQEVCYTSLSWHIRNHWNRYRSDVEEYEKESVNFPARTIAETVQWKLEQEEERESAIDQQIHEAMQAGMKLALASIDTSFGNDYDPTQARTGDYTYWLRHVAEGNITGSTLYKEEEKMTELLKRMETHHEETEQYIEKMRIAVFAKTKVQAEKEARKSKAREEYLGQSVYPMKQVRHHPYPPQCVVRWV